MRMPWQMQRYDYSVTVLLRFYKVCKSNNLLLVILQTKHRILVASDLTGFWEQLHCCCQGQIWVTLSSDIIRVFSWRQKIRTLPIAQRSRCTDTSGGRYSIYRHYHIPELSTFLPLLLSMAFLTVWCLSSHVYSLLSWLPLTQLPAPL